jgi:hypothetical protein
MDFLKKESSTPPPTHDIEAIKKIKFNSKFPSLHIDLDKDGPQHNHKSSVKRAMEKMSEHKKNFPFGKHEFPGAVLKHKNDLAKKEKLKNDKRFRAYNEDLKSEIKDIFRGKHDLNKNKIEMFKNPNNAHKVF